MHLDSLKPGEFEQMSKVSLSSQSLAVSNLTDAFEQPFWASVAFYNLGLTVTKLSVLFQFLRFFVTTKTRRACWALAFLVGIYGVAIFVVSICSCHPVAFFWDKTIRGGSCIDLLAFWYTNAIFNIVTDIAVVTLPIHVLKTLQVPKRQRWALMVIFALGGL